MTYSDTNHIICRYDENGKLIFNTNNNEVPDEWLTENEIIQEAGECIYDFFYEYGSTILQAAIYIIILICLFSLAKNILSKQQHKSEKNHIEEQEKPVLGNSETNEEPQIIYIKQKQNGCITFLLILATVCIILYTLPRLIASGSLIYFFLNI